MKTGEDRKARVLDEQPLRHYRGETFYQSNSDQVARRNRVTGIQVVRNSGWLIPSVACSVYGAGNAVHFWGTVWHVSSPRRVEKPVVTRRRR